MSNVIREDVSLYPDIIAKVKEMGYSDEILSNIYRSEALWTRKIPLISEAPHNIKILFWELPMSCTESNIHWVVDESKKYSKLDVFLQQLYGLHYEKPLKAQEIFSCFEDIELMPYSQCGQMTGYYMEQFLEILQKEFLYDEEKCLRIAQLEIIFTNLLEWPNMKCFHHIIKRSPELFAQLVAGAFGRDHEHEEIQKLDAQYINNMIDIYKKAHFCPAEENGEVNEEKLRQWIEKFRILLEQNDQISLFGFLLGRLFSFSPIGKDGHRPCEAVREIIEQYADDRMRSTYKTCIYNQRGMHSPSAGKAEMRMAEEFKSNAEYLKPEYPETAKIYDNLYEHYKRESGRERIDAEIGWY